MLGFFKLPTVVCLKSVKQPLISAQSMQVIINLEIPEVSKVMWVKECKKPI